MVGEFVATQRASKALHALLPIAEITTEVNLPTVVSLSSAVIIFM
jgi:hypothetical protein